jgi:RHS repeat-associated protein
VAAIVNGNKYAVHADHLNTPRRLTNQYGEAAWQWKFSAFGDENPTRAAKRFVDPEKTPGMGSGTVADVTYNLRYPGQTADQESGLYYNYFRWYNSSIGRYGQTDPIGLQGGWNRFLYVDGDALTGFDPLGLANGGGRPLKPRPKRQDTCTCSDIIAFRAEIGKDKAAGGTDYGHYWLEIGSHESYGYWPTGQVGGLSDTFGGVPGSLNRGMSRDPHHGDRDALSKSFPLKTNVPPTKGQSCEQMCSRAKQCIRDTAQNYTLAFGATWSYRFDAFGDNNCHTFQKRVFKQCGLTE